MLHVYKNSNIIWEFLLLDIHLLTIWSVEVTAEYSGATYDRFVAFNFPTFDGCDICEESVEVFREEDREDEKGDGVCEDEEEEGD